MWPDAVANFPSTCSEVFSVLTSKIERALYFFEFNPYRSVLANKETVRKSFDT